MDDRAALLVSWARRDAERAVLPADRELIESTASLRGLILDGVLSPDDPDELYDACAAMGRTIAQQGGSPTFASATLDGARDVLGPAAAWLPPARAALMEGYAAVMMENVRRHAARAWEYPACAVRLGEAAVAITAGYPSDDDEEIAAWAARVAKAAALSGVRRAVVSGNAAAADAVLDAFGLVGIDAQMSPAPAR